MRRCARCCPTRRRPDAALTGPDGKLFNPTAALAVEILSPGDDTPRKLGFYAAHAVDELLIVDPETRTVQWLALSEQGGYEPTERSTVIDHSVDQLAARCSQRSGRSVKYDPHAARVGGRGPR